MTSDFASVTSARRICLSILVVAAAAGYIGWAEWENRRHEPLFFYLELLLDIDDAFRNNRAGGWQAWKQPVGPNMIQLGRPIFDSEAKAIPLGETHAGTWWCKAIGYESNLRNQDGSARAYLLLFDELNCGRPLPPPVVYVDYKNPKSFLQGRYFIFSPETITRIRSLDPRAVATFLPNGKREYGVMGDVVSEQNWLREWFEEHHSREIIETLAATRTPGQSWKPFTVWPEGIAGLVRAVARYKTGLVEDLSEAGLKRAFRDVLGSAPADANLFGFRVAARAVVTGMPLVLLALSAGLWHRLRRASASWAVDEPWLLISPVGCIEKALAWTWIVGLAMSGVLVGWAASLYGITDPGFGRIATYGCAVFATLFIVASLLHIWALNKTLKNPPIVRGLLFRLYEGHGIEKGLPSVMAMFRAYLIRTVEGRARDLIGWFQQRQ